MTTEELSTWLAEYERLAQEDGAARTAEEQARQAAQPFFDAERKAAAAAASKLADCAAIEALPRLQRTQPVTVAYEAEVRSALAEANRALDEAIRAGEPTQTAYEKASDAHRATSARFIEHSQKFNPATGGEGKDEP